MTFTRKAVVTLLMALLLPSLIGSILIEGSAQQEMIPEWVIENESPVIKLAASAEGKYLATVANDTNMLYMFCAEDLLWTYPVDHVSSLAMSADGKYVAVGTKHGFYLFDRQSPPPQAEFRFDCKNSLVAISASGNITTVGTTSHAHDDSVETQLYLFEKENPTPTWNNTFPGVLESLSISDDGDYIVASTSQPGTLYMVSTAHANPVWTYNFGERSGGAKISNNGNYIVAAGGNQTSEKDLRIYRFRRQSSIPNYMKAIADLPSTSGIALSANGSRFAISYTSNTSSSLMFFNLELPPYGYGPGSVLKVPLPSHTVSMTMSSDGGHIIVGTVDGIFAYEYANRQLTLAKQYTVNEPSIIDLASSANGQFIIAAATGQNSKQSTVYLFDNFKEPQDSLVNLLLKLFLPAIIVAVAVATTIYVLGKKQRAGSRRARATAARRNDKGGVSEKTVKTKLTRAFFLIRPSNTANISQIIKRS